MRRPFAHDFPFGSLLGAVLGVLLAAPTVAQPPLPSPGLEGLEASVARQIASTRELLASVLAEQGEGPRAAELYGEMGRLYHTYELLDAALAAYRNASRLEPENILWHHAMGLVHRAEGRLEEAEAAFLKVRAGWPAGVTSRLYLGEIYLEQGRLEVAEKLLESALYDAPDEASILAALGQLALSRRQYGEAARRLEQALEAAPAADSLYYPLAIAYRGQGEVEKAKTALAKKGLVGVAAPDPFVRGLEELKQGEIAHLLRGRMAYRAERYAEAAESFRAALEASPESLRARTNLASALVSLGETEEAIEHFRRVLEGDPESTTALYNLGVMMASRGEDEQAATYLGTLVEIDRGDAGAHLELAQVQRRLGRLEQALVSYKRAAQLQPASEDAHLGGASILVDLGRYAEARDHLERVRATMPQQGRLTHALAKLLAASPDPAVRDGERALELARLVFEARRSVGHAETVALALAETGRCAEAAEWQRQASEVAAEAGQTALAQALAAGAQRYAQGPPCRPPVDPALSPPAG